MTTCSVLVCTYNRPELLAKSLEALVVGTLTKPDQIVVVNGGDERADAVVRHYQALGTVLVDLVKTVNRNLAASRNIGLAHCTGDIVAMTDDDAEVYPDWVARMVGAHAEHPEAGAVGGAVIGAESSHSLLSRLSDVAVFPSSPSSGYVRTLPGVNVSYKRAVVAGAGPQDETLFRGEDVDFNWRVKHLGYEVFYDPAIRVLHHHRPDLRGFVRQNYMYGRAYYLVRSKWPDMYCVYPHGLRRFRDVLKAAHFVVAALWEPVTVAQRMPRAGDRLVSMPILIVSNVAWRAGMVRQCLLQRSARVAGR